MCQAGLCACSSRSQSTWKILKPRTTAPEGYGAVVVRAYHRSYAMHIHARGRPMEWPKRHHNICHVSLWPAAKFSSCKAAIDSLLSHSTPLRVRNKNSIILCWSFLETVQNSRPWTNSRSISADIKRLGLNDQGIGT